LDDQWRSAEDLRGASAARLNAALGRSADAPVPWPAAIAEERVEVPDAEVLAWLVQASPELKELDHEIAREGHAIELARKDYWPDVGLGLGYMNQREIMEGSEDHMVVGMISVTLPIWRDKYAAEVREAEARRLAARHMRDDRQNMLAADVKMALYNLRDASRKINLYRDTLVPTAKESLKATEAAYRTGTANFVDLVDGERMLLEFRLMQERALTDHAARLAELEMLVGREMPRTVAPPAQGKAVPETAKSLSE
jgi:outer membrane protein TolC